MFGISDLVGFLKTDFAKNDWWRTSVGDINDPVDAKDIEAKSPFHHAEKITAPLLLTTGSKDERVQHSRENGLWFEKEATISEYSVAQIQEAFKGARWFETDGCYTLFDGQYGSTGKGLLASLIGQTMGHKIDTVTTNAGPNSGHTGYLNGDKILTQQIPVASVVMRNLGYSHSCYLNAGAIIDPNQLWKEICEYGYDDKTLVNESPLFIHPAAAVIKPEHQGDQHSDIASTGKGVGPAMEAKISRNDQAVFGGFTPVAWDEFYSCHNWVRPEKISYANLGRCFVETAQGWSLGINSGFYPYTTSRECSVTQALSATINSETSSSIVRSAL